MSLPDIDIDFADRNEILNELIHIQASIIKNKEIERHNTGVYFQEILLDPVSHLASIDHKTAKQLGYFKFDFLNVNLYKQVKNNEHLTLLCNTEPQWNMLRNKDVVDNLFHLNGNFDIVNRLRPTNINQLAIVLAIKIPCKRYLINKTWHIIESEIWLPDPKNEFIFKKSHAFSYAMLVMVQMNLISGI